jgi:hypothetical protein
MNKKKEIAQSLLLFISPAKRLKPILIHSQTHKPNKNKTNTHISEKKSLSKKKETEKNQT